MKGLRAIALGIFFVVVTLPIVWVVLSSFKTNPELFSSPWGLPKTPKPENYVEGWNSVGGRAFANSLIATVLTLVVLLPTGAMAAYIFAKFTFSGSKALFGAFLGGMMFPNFLVVIPLFFLLKNLHLNDTMSGLVLAYIAYSYSFTIFVLTGFFQAIPDELAEAACLDGCSHAATFWKVMFPLARPGLIVVGIFDAIGLWNEYPLAMVLLSSPETRTLPLGIADLALAQNYSSNWSALFAAMVLVMAPVLVVYWIFKDKIQQAMLAGAVKG